MYSPYAEKVREFRFGAAVERDTVAAAIVYGTGVLVVTEAQLQPAPPGSSTPTATVSEPGSIWLVEDLREPRPTRLTSPPLTAFTPTATEDNRGDLGGSGLLSLGGLGRLGLPSCVAVLDPRHTLSTRVEVRPLHWVALLALPCACVYTQWLAVSIQTCLLLSGPGCGRRRTVAAG